MTRRTLNLLQSGSGRGIYAKALNESYDSEQKLRERIIRELFGSTGDAIWIEPPFYCDYGSNITDSKALYSFVAISLFFLYSQFPPKSHQANK